ncbi:YeeE/YedE family protein [Hyphomicrobium sp. 99]|uniref:YeeE/YedE family protein n=1 Tax=Hyphomicrobium sp. 99 TaxID=1163419 RepID=UPI0005F7DC16|nr:YeeE/YedE family protein [Hyphomicrobium sp. 99]
MAIETEFTPLASSAGGALIGVSAVLLMYSNGRIAGISGIVKRLIAPAADSKPEQALAFIVGLILAPFVWTATTGNAVAQSVSTNIPLAAIAGLLVGFGAALGGGCTSGHGVCGLSRFSKRSLAATIVFMTVGALTVFVARHIVGGA